MVDTLSSEQRSALMKRVKQTGTAPELVLRKELHRMGFRYLVDDNRLPGTPDIVLPRYKTVVFMHGCFWHGHSCRQGRAPASNIEYWRPKIHANQERDARKESQLVALGWQVITVWSCELSKKRLGETIDKVVFLIKRNK
ncbi:very short patch repair endonuclease [Janthinobacterium sp. RB2R34]|uniref:very short patch repair endonuclease n=1 Tax=Janthinobacterium sp. RB2R34 TaxID=3424193 RepID=UPI003F2734B4